MIEIDGKQYFDKDYFDKDYFETKGYKSPYNKQNFNRESYLHWALVTWIVQSLKLHGTERVLEIGCAYGWTVEQFIKRYKMDVCGQDISAYATANAPLEIKHKIHECTNIEIAFDDTFDLIYSLETFEHVPNPLVSDYFKNIYNALNDNGILFCTICLGWNDDRGADIDQSHQTLQPRDWWNNKLEEAGFILRKDLEAEAYELGLQTANMVQGEWLPRKYNWHVFAAQKVKDEVSDNHLPITLHSSGVKPNMLLLGNRNTTFDYPIEPFFQIDNWGNYLYTAFNARYTSYKLITQADLDSTDIIIATLCVEVIDYINSMGSFSGKILGIIDGTPLMIESPTVRPKLVQCLQKVDIVGNVHTDGIDLYSLFCDRSKIVNYGHMFPINAFDEIYTTIEHDEFTVLTGGYFNSRCGFASISALLAAAEVDKVISPTLPGGFKELEITNEVLPDNIELLHTIPQNNFWEDILPRVDVLLHLGNDPATGRLTADCAAAGIPGIGISTQYQNICFPELLIPNVYSIEKARYLLCKLRDDKNFYNEIAISGRQRLINSNVIQLHNMKNILNRLGFDVYINSGKL